MAPPPPRPWADLPPELVSCIADRLAALRCYLAARGVCKAWRSALEPASPYVVLRGRRDSERIRRGRAAVASIPLQRSFQLPTSHSYNQCIGSSGSWLAFAHHSQRHVAFFNPLTGRKLKLVLKYPAPHRIVFAPNPSESDFAAVATRRPGAALLVYVTARETTCSSLLISLRSALVDVVYHAGGAAAGKFYCLLKNGDVQILRAHGDGRRTKPALEPLLGGVLSSSSVSDPAGTFAPPYAELSEHIRAKHLVFCEGNLYQIWRNTGGAMDLQLPGGGSLHVSSDEVFVLRCAPARRPCWEVVEDMGGHSVFIGSNNAVAVHAEGVAGLKGDCVYWVGPYELEEAMAMVFDMKTRRSTPCLPSPVYAIGWYFLGDMARSGTSSAVTT